MSPEQLNNSFRTFMRSFYFGPGSKGFGLLKCGLVGLVPVYKFFRFLNQSLRSIRRRQLSTPVISIGNLSIGGTAKTAFVRWMCEHLVEEGYQPAILKRGEGHRDGVVTPDMDVEDAVCFGDEVALLRESLPSVPIGVGPNRYERGRQIEQGYNVDCFVMDDGFQHRQLVRNLDVVLLGSRDELSGWELPAGPLREPPSALERADVISLNSTSSGTEQNGVREIERRRDWRRDQIIMSHRYRFEGIVRHNDDVTEQFRNGEVHLLTTQARPERLESELREHGFSISVHRRLGDHDRIPGEVFDGELDPSKTVVTDKEWVKLPEDVKREVGRVRSDFVVAPSDRFLREVSALLENESL